MTPQMMTQTASQQTPFLKRPERGGLAETVGRYLVLTRGTKAKSRVKANLIVQCFKDKDLN